MTQNLGKKFEDRVKRDWKETVKDSFFFRLNDQVSGFYGASRNPCDVVAYKKPLLYLLELKTIKGNTFPVDFRQYEELIKYKDISGVVPGVIV